MFYVFDSNHIENMGSVAGGVEADCERPMTLRLARTMDRRNPGLYFGMEPIFLFYLVDENKRQVPVKGVTAYGKGARLTKKNNFKKIHFFPAVQFTSVELKTC
jgi:hypothetical protein